MRSYRTVPPLPANAGGTHFCGTIPEVTLAGRYPASCPMELGLSSSGLKPAAIIFRTQLFILTYLEVLVNTIDCKYIMAEETEKELNEGVAAGQPSSAPFIR